MNQFGDVLGVLLKEHAARAVAEERERCARIVEQTPITVIEPEALRAKIAAEIRRGT